MASCWRTLAQHPDIDLYVGVLGLKGADNAGFRERALLEGIKHDVFDEAAHLRELPKRVVAHNPDVVVLAGWHQAGFRAMPSLGELRDCKFVMTMDTPWRWHPRQLMGRVAHRSYFAKMSRVVVAGERTWMLARWLGFSERQIVRGTYAIDTQSFASTYARRVTRDGGWPRAFLYMGRYVQEKGIDVLIDAHRRYAVRVTNPWPLDCYGQGPLAHLLEGPAGVSNRGFVQPKDQPGVMEQAGCFVLPSRYEPWGVVLAEAAASGLPLIASESCGASVDLVQHLYNGYRVTTDDAEHLARAMGWMHEHWARLPELGRRSNELAGPFSNLIWRDRWLLMIEEIMGQTGQSSLASTPSSALGSPNRAHPIREQQQP